MSLSRPRVVFDCNVLIQAAANEDGPAAEALRQLEANRIAVYVSRATIKELRSVLNYPTVRQKNPAITDTSITALIDRLMFRATLVRRVRHVLDYPRARQDEAYIDLASEVDADFLVSRDKDLLSLMSGHSAVCKQFRQKTHPLRVIDPIEFLAAIGRPWKRPI